MYQSVKLDIIIIRKHQDGFVLAISVNTNILCLEIWYDLISHHINNIGKKNNINISVVSEKSYQYTSVCLRFLFSLRTSEKCSGDRSHLKVKV